MLNLKVCFSKVQVSNLEISSYSSKSQVKDLEIEVYLVWSPKRQNFNHTDHTSDNQLKSIFMTPSIRISISEN